MLLGRVEPRIGTPRGDYKTYGAVLEGLANVFGLEGLMAWQRLAADRALEYVQTSDGPRWVHNSVTILVAVRRP